MVISFICKTLVGCSSQELNLVPFKNISKSVCLAWHYLSGENENGKLIYLTFYFPIVPLCTSFYFTLHSLPLFYSAVSMVVWLLLAGFSGPQTQLLLPFTSSFPQGLWTLGCSNITSSLCLLRLAGGSVLNSLLLLISSLTHYPQFSVSILSSSV